MNRKHYLFDVDGTLTKPMQKMSAPFRDKFLKWMEGRSVFLVAGSNLEKVDEQVPTEVIGNCAGVFCSMANQFWRGRGLVYENEWLPAPDLLASLTDIQELSSYTNKKENWIEMRVGMINFTTAGRSSTRQERESYHEWDKENRERESIVEQLSEKFPDLDFRIGGQISIDIQPKGCNKSQASKWVREDYGGTIVYFGDNCEVGGNDYDICFDVIENGGIVHEVKSPDETLSILNNEN